MNHLLVYVTLFMVSFAGWAQQDYRDTLKEDFENSKNSHQKHEAFLKLANWLFYEGEEENSSALIQKTIDRTKNDSSQQLLLIEAYSQMSRLSIREENYTKAKAYIDSARTQATQHETAWPMAIVDLAEGRLLEYIDNRDEAHALYTKALTRIEDRSDQALLKAILNYQLYALFVEWNELDQAKQHIEQTATAAKKFSPKNFLANAYSGKAMVFSYMLDESKADTDRDSMMHYAHKSIQLYRDFPGEITANTHASNLLNEANYYWRYLDKKNPENLRKIKVNIEEAFEVSADKNNNEVNMANGYGMLSSMSIAEKDYDKAENYLQQAFSLLMTRKKPYYPTLINVAKGLSNVYAIKEDFQKALQFEREASDYRHKLFDEEAANTVKRLEAQYEFEKKETEIAFLKEKSDRQRKQNLLYISLIIIGAVGAFFMFRSYHFNLKYSLAREKQLKAEHKESETELKLRQEEQNLLQTEQKLLALQKQQLQDEIMARELQLQYKNDVLQELKSKLSSDNALNLQQLLKEETRSNHNFEEVKFQLQKIHPSFFKSLTAKSYKKLTALDLKYCAYLYLGMETKQIAQIMGVAPKSIRVTKYRLKKKFNLPKEVDLIDFLKKTT